ncbi:MAG: hypothetical protein Kow0047_06790 [Anaerolineae bacterium]
MWQVPFEDDLFVNRDDELHATSQLIASLIQDGHFPEHHRIRAIRFWGPIGAGKSWLLRYILWLATQNSESRASSLSGVAQGLSEQLQRCLVLRVCLIQDLDPYDQDGSLTYCRSSYPIDCSQAETEVERILRWLIEQVIRERGAEVAWPPQGDIQSLSERLKREIETTNVPLVLLVDGADEQPTALIERLEAYLLQPLLAQGRTAFVLAMRVPPITHYVWSYEVREGSRDVLLHRFSSDTTREQFERASNYVVIDLSDKDVVERIIELTGGYPGANMAVASSPTWKTGDRDALIEVLQRVADILLTGVDDPTQEILRRLCCLRRIDPSMARILLGKPDGPDPVRPLVRTRLIFWSRDVGAYEMDGVLRRILEILLYLEDRDTWRKLHETAATTYEQWSEEYPQSADIYRTEMEYHHQRQQRDLFHEKFK